MEKITDKIAALPPSSHYSSLEFFPPKTSMGFSNLQQRLERMSTALRPLFVNVTWGAGGSTATKSLELAEICQRQLGLTTCLHLTCTNMSRSLIDEALEQAKVLGIRNILALRGDPPRSNEYREEGMPPLDGDHEDEFVWAVDLVKYIKRQHGDYFCIGVATYPEGHSDESHPEKQDPAFDLPYLIEKTRAGADFLMTQLFYDVKAYQEFEKMLREDPSGVFKDITIIPGLMPIQSYQILRRTTKLSHAKLPPDILSRLDAVKSDDEAVKRVGVDILSEIVETLKSTPSPSSQPRGFHFYTLNLEKAVAHILERCDLIPPSTPTPAAIDITPDDDDDGTTDTAIDDSFTTASSHVLVNGTHNNPLTAKSRRRLSSLNSAPHNRVIISRPSSPSATSTTTTSAAQHEAPEDEAGIPRGEALNSRAHTLAISEGEGALGREATWDDFPNGRWGDARSPAFGEIDGYGGVSLHVSVGAARELWGWPVSREDVSEVFRRYLKGELRAVPWSVGSADGGEGLSKETATIRRELLGLIGRKGWWSVASQPAVNGVRSGDEVFGWGPRNGFVFQKPFVEFFLGRKDWEGLRRKLEGREEEVTFFAGNAAGDFEASDAKSVNPVTWGSFSGKEIITPTIIEAVSFRAWCEEAFGIWGEWERIYPVRSATAKLIRSIREDVWLVNIIHHAFMDKDAIWKLLLED
ncbi:methylenetetrahydrofolate reduct [Viridothelium virens]|uniref:Methylenetetrahydrofolate reduct n=1 Tax=Viridothelium virens TaxID=1048519 RepID=A0A6A6H2Q7_VIRVR|nr:methylenetetrahydrofolate reduct [Viridothelium virens]